MMYADATEVLLRIRYKPGYRLRYQPLPLSAEHDLLRIWWEFERPDVTTGEPGVGVSGDTIVNIRTATEESLVRTVFSLAMRLEEHECREWLTYKGLKPFDPHYSLVERANLYRWMDATR